MDFFNKIGSKITEASQGVQVQAKTMTETTRLNLAISNNDKDIANLYMELGKEYFNSINATPSGLGDAFVNKINELLLDNSDIRADLANIKGVIFCQNCNAECPISYNCCSSCGTTLNKSAITLNLSPCCTNCGKQIADGLRFCTGCGSPIPDKSSSNASSGDSANADTNTDTNTNTGDNADTNANADTDADATNPNDDWA